MEWAQNAILRYPSKEIYCIPERSGVGNGNVWVIKREIVSDGTFIPYQEFLSGNDWIRGSIWYDLIAKQKAGIITEAEKLILKNGHFKVK